MRRQECRRGTLKRAPRFRQTRLDKRRVTEARPEKLLRKLNRLLKKAEIRLAADERRLMPIEFQQLIRVYQRSSAAQDRVLGLIQHRVKHASQVAHALAQCHIVFAGSNTCLDRGAGDRFLSPALAPTWKGRPQKTIARPTGSVSTARVQGTRAKTMWHCALACAGDSYTVIP
jgi:hypothetical protein